MIHDPNIKNNQDERTRKIARIEKPFKKRFKAILAKHIKDRAPLIDGYLAEIRTIQRLKDGMIDALRDYAHSRRVSLKKSRWKRSLVDCELYRIENLLTENFEEACIETENKFLGPLKTIYCKQYNQIETELKKKVRTIE